MRLASLYSSHWQVNGKQQGAPSVERPICPAIFWEDLGRWLTIKFHAMVAELDENAGKQSSGARKVLARTQVQPLAWDMPQHQFS
jgi:hypothetical protein